MTINNDDDNAIKFNNESGTYCGKLCYFYDPLSQDTPESIWLNSASNAHLRISSGRNISINSASGYTTFLIGDFHHSRGDLNLWGTTVINNTMRAGDYPVIFDGRGLMTMNLDNCVIDFTGASINWTGSSHISAPW
jgi:hypothetical protein